MTVQYDVAIIGAGPAGSSSAYFLARSGIKVLLLDKATFPRDKTCGDGLVPRALPILTEMGVLDSVMQRSRGFQLNELEVSAPSGRAVRFTIPDLPYAPNHAVVVNQGAEFFSGVRVRGLRPDTDGITISSDNMTYRARLAIVATGANTALLDIIGLNPPKPNIVAARAYYEGIESLPSYFQFRFDGVVLPGYGWVFPLSATSANIGAGFIRTGKREHNQSAQTVFQSFVENPALKQMLRNAKQVGTLKSFPIRTDFASAPLFAERILLVGEAAGLVNPLTGDGIDFALESGKIAAEHIATMLKFGDFSRSQLQAYDTILRQRYQNLFRFSTRVSRMALNRRALNWLVPLAASRPKLPETLVNILLGAQPAPEKLSLLRIVKGVAARL